MYFHLESIKCLDFTPLNQRADKNKLKNTINDIKIELPYRTKQYRTKFSSDKTISSVKIFVTSKYFRHLSDEIFCSIKNFVIFLNFELVFKNSSFPRKINKTTILNHYYECISVFESPLLY